MHRSFARGLAAAMFALSGTAATAAPPLPDAALFFGNQGVSAALLSPDGRSLAIRSAAGDQRDSLAVLDLASNKVSQVAGFANVDIRNVQWVNNQRMVFDTTDKRYAARDHDGGPGIYAVNRDGSNLLQLVSRRARAEASGGLRQKIQPWNTFLLDQPGAQDSDSIYVARPDLGRGIHRGLLQLNTLTGHVTSVPRTVDTEYWMLDQRGEPRLALSRDKEARSVHYLDPVSGWRQLARFDAKTAATDEFMPLAFGPDGTLYVIAQAGKDKAAVHTLDLATGKIRPQPVVVTADHDFEGRLVMGKDRLIGMRVQTDVEQTIWLDDGMKALQKLVDERLPGLINIITIPKRAETPWVLVESYSDVQPSVFQVYDTQAKTFRVIGTRRPGIAPGAMGQQQTVHYQARDKLSIPALLTLPPGEKRSALPLVVVVHDGPFARGPAWGWAPVSQFLASRGYAVLDPKFRGSAGFGESHLRAGFRQWGGAMQDDVADGVRWAVEQGIADPKRVCILGAGYGGYSVLMGLVRDPGLYQCGLSWAAITDIGQMFEPLGIFGLDLAKRYHKYDVKDVLGDRVSEAEQLKTISPVERAAQLRKPLLLAFGGADEDAARHTRKFHAEVSKGNPDVELVEYPKERHMLAMPENRIDYWNRVEKFLKRHIGQ